MAGPGPLLLGAVLGGGSSRRMGVDKASMPVGGRPMARWAADVLHGMGASEVVLVGGGAEAASAPIGVAMVPDGEPGTGPLGGLCTALAWAHARSGVDVEAILVVAACDQPSLTPGTLLALTEGLAAAPSSVGAVRFLTPDGRAQPLPSAWRVREAVGPVTELHRSGERRIGAAFEVVPTVDLPGDVDLLVDLDTPADLARWLNERVEGPDGGRHRP